MLSGITSHFMTSSMWSEANPPQHSRNEDFSKSLCTDAQKALVVTLPAFRANKNCSLNSGVSFTSSPIKFLTLRVCLFSLDSGTSLNFSLLRSAVLSGIEGT